MQVAENSHRVCAQSMRAIHRDCVCMAGHIHSIFLEVQSMFIMRKLSRLSSWITVDLKQIPYIKIKNSKRK